MLTDTSREAHEAIQPRAQTLEAVALELLRVHGPLTADEAATLAGCTPLAMRPRFTSLKKQGKIEDSGERRKNASGRSAAVWQLVDEPPPPMEQGTLL